LWIAGIAFALAGGTALGWFVVRRRPPPSPPAGISHALAIDRAQRVSQLKYTLELAVPSERREPITGRLTATFALPNASAPIAFDFNQAADHLKTVETNGRRTAAVVGNGHVVIPAYRLRKGMNVVRFDFVAGDESLNRSDDFLYSLFVPARASLAMPCFDQPDLKARWQITLEVPTGWAAVSNEAEADRSGHEGRTRITFKETEPISTYLVAFSAGRYEIETAVRGGRTLRIFHRENDRDKVTRNREAIFDLHASAIAWLQSYTGLAYPFGKFDVVLIPAFQFSGMEHPGAIYYNASTLFLDPSATQNQYLTRANTIAHETSHMWFGDLVTMKWFDDVWLKEVFANFMASKIVNPSFPGINHDVRFLLQNYPAAYEVDRTEGANPIRQDLANLDDAGSLYGAIIYQKAPVVMRQLERLMGADEFRAGLREYLRTFSFGNATWTDLVRLLDDRTPVDLAAWSRAWVDEPGRPVIQVDPRSTKGQLEHVVLHQRDPRGRNLVWPQTFDLRFDSTSASASSVTVKMDSADPVVDVPSAPSGWRWIVPVGGYGYFDLDLDTAEYLSRSIVSISDGYTRASALVEIWEAMLEGRIAPGRILDNLLLAVSREPDELILQQMLDDIRVAFWRFTAADDRAAVAAKIEPVLRAGVARAPTASLKGAWFEAFRRTAITPDGVQWLASIWRHEQRIEGLTLAETDEAEMAAELALRDPAHAAQILQDQLGRFQNTDRKERFAFAMPALSNDSRVRDRFFESLGDVNNRRHEAWVLDAVRYLHHPLRAAASKRYVPRALALTREIQDTGDIFFPKRWADATLSGYQSVQTAAEVRTFIDRLPEDYPPRLRGVLLASADPLFRAARLLSQ
jgi:aminopeptidase N